MDKEIADAILEELLCPVCDHYMCPPIYLCVTGHSLCEDCFKKVKTCPKCRAAKSNNARNYALEGVHGKLNVPCKFAIYGCDFILPGEDIKKHQVFCSYARVHCPFRFYDNCQWNQSKTTLKAHLTKKHSLNFYLKDKQKFLSRSFTAIENYHYIYAVIFTYEEFFRLTWDLNETTGMTRWAVYYVGSPENAKNYSYKLEFCKDEAVSNSCPPLTYKSVCIAKPEKEDQKFVEHHCFYVHKNLLQDYCTEVGDLNYKVSIYCVKRIAKKVDVDAFLDSIQSIYIGDENIEKSDETLDKTWPN
ncbi:unnamed protein product [Phaedon cochleariae]|uniref:E3 ubiquitin-protein ligase n=1 Tax=Phaedon cochleariae TaxID=80249 RepID=A0A9P0GIC4_PHACE|nr:unnamed protein product [Phaedon cochleariae]